MTKTKLTAGQRKFLKAVAAGEHGVFHVSVTAPLWNAEGAASLVYPRVGSLFPWIVGCNGQSPTDYHLTEAGAALLAA